MTNTTILSALPWPAATVAAFVAFVLLGAVASAAEKRAAPRLYDIPAGDAVRTLKKFVEQSGEQVVFLANKVRGAQTNAIKGEFTAREALERMLAASGLGATQDEQTGALTINQISAPTGPAKKNAEKKTADDAAAVTTLEAFSVTGSNIRMNASEADRGRLPVEFISSEKFQFTSGERIGDFLRGQSFIAGAYLSAGGTGAGGWTSMSIHGVGRNYTLQLADGRRIMEEDTVSDISGLPPEAIESVEVLKGGASAIYGSSAVGGVLNIKLLKRFEGAETLLSYGNTLGDDAGFKRVALLYGVRAGPLRVVGSVSLSNRAEVSARDRTPTNTSDFRAWGGLDRRLATSGDPMRIVLASSPGTPLILDRSRFRPGQTGATAADYVAWSQQANTIETVPYTLISQDRRGQGHWNADYEIFGRQLVVFASGYFDNHQTRDRSTASSVTVTVPAANPYNPFNQPATVFYRFNGTELNADQANLVQNIWSTVSYQGVFGLRGETAGFSYELGLNNAALNRTQTIFNDVATQLAQAAANRTDATALNVFGYNANTAAQTAGLTPSHGYEFKNKLSMLDLKISGPILQLPTGTASMALGAERRRSDYQRISDLAWSTYTFGVSGNFQSTPHYQRTATAYFGEATVPVFKRQSAAAVIATAEVNGALRRDNYSDYRGTTIHSVSLSTRGLDDSLVLRALYSQGVRAPFETDLKAPNATTTLNGLFDPVRGGVFPVTRITGGNPNLKAERADTFDYGVVYSPARWAGVTLRADYWSVDIKDRIFAPAAQDILNGIASGGSLSRDPVSGAVTIDGRSANGTERAAAGYDVGVSYSLTTGRLGRFAFDFNSTFTTKFWDKSSGVVSSLLDHYAGSTNLSGGGGGTEPIPRLRSVLSAFWYRGSWNAGLTLHYSAGLHDTVVGLVDRRSEAYSTGDFQVSYAFAKSRDALGGMLRNVRLSLGVDNAWNEALPFVAATTSGWDQSISDPRGRYLYFSVRKKL